MRDPERDALRAQCTRFLSHHDQARLRPKQHLRELADAAEDSEEPDAYGEGAIIERFEAEVAALLAKPAALFLPSGTMAQQIALAIWCERRNLRRVAFHPRCHLELHEQKGYQALHGLHAVLVGGADELLTPSHLEALREPIAALLVELPQREIGGQLPSWDQLQATAQWATERGVMLHLDGARLWESAPFYARSYAEIAAPFASVYVSFYKGLGGAAGAMLLGDADFVAQARVWQRRHGGNLVHLFPYIVSARAGMRERLGRMGAYHERAVAIGRALVAAGHEIVPDPPHTNMMHVFLRGDREKLKAAALAVARDRRVWMFNSLMPTPMPSIHKFELTVGDASMQLDPKEVASLLDDLRARAGSGAAR